MATIFIIAGPKSLVDSFVAKLQEEYELKEWARLGAAVGGDKGARVPNRVVRWTPHL